MLTLILCIGTWPGPSIITWQPLAQAILRQFAERFEFGELRAVVGVRDRAGTQPVAERERHVVLAHQIANLVEAFVEEALLVMRETPLRHDRAAARDDAGHAVRRQRNEGKPHTGVDREVIDALLALLDERVAIELPRQLHRIAAAFFQRLIDRHRADRNRRIADDPFARRVNVAARRKVHDRVGAPSDRPHHLLDFLLDRRGNGRVADIGVDLHEEVAADDHRLQFAVINVRRNDRPTTGDLIAHELGRDVLGDFRAEAFAVADRFLGARQGLARPRFSRCAT